MLNLSELMIQRHDIDTFESLIEAVRDKARAGERFFRIDVKPPYPDTPENWEERLESIFTGRV
jgi:hypothetical protein